MFDRTRRVVLLIDYDNLQICASRDTPGRDLQLDPVVKLAQNYGSVVVARAYAEWNLSTERLSVYKAGIEPAFAPVLRTESDRSGKSLADTVMVAEGMDILWTLAPEVLVLATSDKDLIPLVRVAKQRGARVVVLGSDFTAIPLREMADEHVTYKQLITEGVSRGGETSAARPQVIPADGGRRSRVRDRDRDRDRGEAREGREGAREARAPREQREPVAVAEPAPSVSAEPVAPVSAGTSSTGDAESGLARRRRRRGSRRRTDRLGVGGEGDENGTTEAEEAEESAEEVTPAEVFEASSGTVEAVTESEAAAELAEPEAPLAGPGEAHLRDIAGADNQASTWSPSTDAVASERPELPPLSAELAETVNGVTTESEATTPEGEDAGTPPARRPRARRVASARAGRSRAAPR